MQRLPFFYLFVLKYEIVQKVLKDLYHIFIVEKLSALLKMTEF